MSTNRLMRLNLHIFRYEIHNHESLSPIAINAHYNFAIPLLQLVDGDEFDVATYGSQTKRIFISMALLTSKTREFVEAKIPILQQSMHSQKLIIYSAVSSKGIREPIFRD